MADLYGSNEPEDMSSFLQILLHNSSSSPATADSTNATAAAGGYFSGGGVPAATAVAESSSSINFSDPSCFFAKESDGINPSHGIKNFASSFEGSEVSEFPVNPAPSRSSKRSRAAEVHNLSEKRRRSRINEKLKALQNLIPNSNKTDKASMLDEAIEYLKQLQLQVQMLTVRNGLSLHPGYSLGSLQSVLGMESDDGNVLLNANTTNRGMDNFSLGQDVFLQSAGETTNPNSSTPQITMSSLANSSNLGIPPSSFVPSMQNHYGLMNHLAASSKDVCRDDTLSRLQLDIKRSGDASSPGLSS